MMEMLGKGWTTFPKVYPNKAEVQSFPRLFFGYSTYEVDGVFLSPNQRKPKLNDDDKWYSISEECTQVIRLLFKYEVFDRPFPEIDFVKAALRDPFSEIGKFKENYPYETKRIQYYKEKNIDIDLAIAKSDTWIKYVGLFYLDICFSISPRRLKRLVNPILFSEI